MTKYFALGHLEAITGVVQVLGVMPAQEVIKIGLQQFHQTEFELFPTSRRCDYCPKDGCTHELARLHMSLVF